MWDADAGMLCVCVCVIVTQDLRNVEHMYQFSLTSFIALFSRTLRKPMDAKSIDARISALVRPPPCTPCHVPVFHGCMCPHYSALARSQAKGAQCVPTFAAG